ncbi:hypothetical protein Tc00.1047053510591.20 [Trypanosoma cruzi]|uniref:Uncharacterized protein n=1 Tax=Trypanosoma cruzi (strain CL Brener) TaxID=353153 RepID=Q4CS00_TRYCC|nr:hypothetical protein Tc00.1047053510591.20 [Trypanosoma cruzi]EAN83052.1 hypothetical protein Tc00.1047053510591.20 [Trypanosoma cruzi]|eukprot:XP_804903.1 hypothetical protein [Trypanosoma cruzi strain CL Brener]
MEDKDALRVRRGSHPLWECCTACSGIALKCRTITHEDVARSGRSLCVSAAVGVGAAASDLSARWPQRVAVTVFSREICCHAFQCVLLWGQCGGGCAIAEWRERSGGKCVSAAVRSRAGCLAAEDTAHPAKHRSCRAPSITLQHRSRRHQHAARQWMPPLKRMRLEGDTSAVAFRGGTPCGKVACPQRPRGVCTRHRALAVEFLRRGGHCGGVFPHSMWTDACFSFFFHPGVLLRGDTTTRHSLSPWRGDICGAMHWECK